MNAATPDELLQRDPAEPSPTPTDFRLDPELFGTLEASLLGAVPSLTRPQVTQLAGISLDHAHELWAALGFPPPQDDEDELFTPEDVEALRTLRGLVDSGLIQSETESSLARSMGRSFARLAEWEIAEVAAHVLSEETTDLDTAARLIEETLPAIERLQNYIWRRHLASAAGRLLLHATGAADAVPMTVGFADIVGFTRRTRSLSADELAAMIERFESVVNAVIAEHHGRIIKAIGDEVLFVVDDPVDAARIALVLSRADQEDEDFPQVRVGMAHGNVLRRLGDVFGEVVNIASRLTSLARPGKILMSRELADLLRDRVHDGEVEFRVRRARTGTVKGYSRLETWALKGPKETRERSERRRDKPLDVITDLVMPTTD
ncbi:MAG: adenylate/guanylate cyclase domain-containing protein [Nocardioides sp.]|nr:adenylate/guanylate cyclase domain-containing protein [Nocardioides sp.]